MNETRRWIKNALQQTKLSRLSSVHRKKKSILNAFNLNVEPGIGSLIYCQLLTAEHSGIYVGDRMVVQLSGQGNIELVSLEVFTNNLTTVDTDIFIPIDRDGFPITSETTAKNALLEIGGTRKYNLLFDNCHQFSAGCILGDFENGNVALWMVKHEFAELFSDEIKWQRWRWKV